MRIGAHLSIANGLIKTIKEAKEIDANCLQIFSSSPRNWKGPKFGGKEVEYFVKKSREEGISPIFLHSKYLVNLSSKNQKIREKSIKSLIDDLFFSEKIKAQGVIFHPKLKNFTLLINGIKEILSRTPKTTFLILENSARLKIKEISKIFKKIRNRRLKFCLDLAHAFQSGYDFQKSQEIEKIFKEVKKEIGIKNLVLIHANDSKTKAGSFYDRHEDIGKGKIGKIPFFIFLNHPISARIPFIIETPGFREKGLISDKRNLKMLKKLVGVKLDRDFFERKTIKVTKELLGKYLISKSKGKLKVAKILETEVYLGSEDKASHAHCGKTKRNEMMWDKPGKLYVYLIYGIHHCLNIVTEKKGYPAAVLIRKAKPIFGIKEEIFGPGKLCQVFGITKKDNGLDITKSQRIYIKDIRKRPKKIISACRIGVDYAKEWSKKKLRFYIAG